jgi:putative peptide zinc metalloprotease protein
VSEPLPLLRDELVLHAGPTDDRGTPSWTLHDPASNRFFLLRWPAFEILSRWMLGDCERVVSAVNQETTLQIESDDVDEMTQFLVTNHLARTSGSDARERLARIRERMHPGLLKRIVSTYLFFRVPLLKPQRVLDATYPYIAWMFSPLALASLAVIAIAGVYLGLQQWDVLLARLPQFASLEGAVWLAATLTLAKVIHEFGHAYAAHRYGCNVAGMGVAFLVLFPVLYTDTTDAWKLKSHRQRLNIAGAGMVAELALASVALVLWNVLPDGPGRDAALLLATSTWIMTLAVNLNPFMRFDGYFLLCDFLGEENLHERAFAFGRWRLREFFFGFGRPAPEVVSTSMRRFLLFFGYGTWLYRLVLFIGIAVLVYELFFKVLGIGLMFVEIWWFIARPVFREMGEWVGDRHHMRMNGAALRSLLLLCGLVALVLVPWRQDVSAPAVMQTALHRVVSAPRAARVARLHVAVGEQVAADQTLLTLTSPELIQQIDYARLELSIVRAEIAMSGVDERLGQRSAVLKSQLNEVTQRLASLLDDDARLAVVAPFDGRVTALADAVKPGVWIAADEALAYLVQPGATRLSAYVLEEDLKRISPAAPARFYPVDPDLTARDCIVDSIEQTAVTALDSTVLASVHGGPLEVTASPSGALIPERAIYRLSIKGCSHNAAQTRVLPGTVQISANPASLVGRAWQHAYGVFLRESGF